MLRLFTLGGLALERDGQPLEGIANRKLLLALLALVAGHAETGISREKLIAYLWPESDERRGRNSLKQTLFGLRQELGEQVVVSTGSTLRLDPSAIICDLTEFDAALAAGDRAAAARLWLGPFLDGFHLAERTELERWTEAERLRVHRSYVEALQSLGGKAEHENDLAGAVRWWRQAAAVEPYSVQVALGAMRVLVAAGDRVGALEHARLYESALHDDLGLPPEPAVSQFAELLRASGPRSSPGAGVPAQAAPSAPAVLLPMLADGAVAVPAAPRRLVPSGRLIYLLPVLVVLAVAAAMYLLHNSQPGPAVPESPALLTVLPFETVGGTSEADLGRGLDALIASGLDGLAGFRTVPAVARRRGSSSTLTGSAASALARRSGARLYVTGRLVADRNGLRATASLRDRANADREVSRAEAEVPRGELFALADQLVRGLLADMAREPGQRLERAAAMSTRSLPALKVYLEGERRLQADDYGGAMDAFQLAARADSTFGLAYYRLSVAADRAGERDRAVWAARLAGRFSDRLSEHDRRLVTAYVMERSGLLDQAERVYRSILTDYPNDVEAWLQLGELLLHGNPLRGRSATEARDAFSHVLALDPGQGDALVYLARIAALEGRSAEVDSLLRRADALALGGEALDLRAVRAFALSDRPGWGRGMRDLLARPSLVPRRLVLDVAVRLDDLEGSARFAEILAAAPGTCEARALGYRMLAQVRMARGQITKGQDWLERATPCDSAAAGELRAVLAAQPFVSLEAGELTEVRRQLDPLSPSALSPELRAYYAALIDLRLGDTAAAAGTARALQRDADSTAAGDLPRTLAQSLRARLHVARHHPAWALADLESAGWERVADRTMAEAADRFLRAELLREEGRLDEAIGWYGSIAERASYELVFLAPAQLGLGESYEARGDTAAAIAHYRRFVELWRRADPGLQRAVAEAEGRIRGLGGG